MSIPDLRPNPQDTSAYYLAHIYQQSSTQPNGSRPSIPSTLSDPTEPFSPPMLSVWVNGLWISSLVINLSATLLATLIKRWARRFERVAYPGYPRHRPQKRARIRAFYKEGVERWPVPRAVEALLTMHHLSLFLFFAGLSVFLFGVHHTIFKIVTALVSLCVMWYASLSVFPVIYKNCIYSTPFSQLLSFSLIGIRSLYFRTLIFFQLRGFFSRSMIKTAEEYAFRLKPDIDVRSLLWTFNYLEEDAHLEEFFDGLPRLCESETGKELRLNDEFSEPNKEELSNA